MIAIIPLSAAAKKHHTETNPARLSHAASAHEASVATARSVVPRIDESANGTATNATYAICVAPLSGPSI